MSEWKEKRFGDLVSFPPKVKLIKGKEYPFILMEEIEPKTKFVNTNVSKPYNGSGSKFENRDTLFARITPSLENGKIAQARGLNNPGFGSTELYVFRAKKDISDKDFIYYLCRAEFFIQNAVNSYVGASGRQRADAKFIANTILKVPAFNEQHRIASILSAYDELIENNNRRIAILEQMAEQIYKEWFVRMRFPGYENTVFEKGVPKGWEIKLLGDFTEITSSKRIFLSDYVKEGIPFYRGKEISMLSRNEAIEDLLYIDINKFIEIKSRFGVPKVGDILVTAVGTIGNIHLVNENDGDFYFKDGNLIWLKNIGNQEISLFLFSMFNTQEFKDLLDLISIGSSQKALTIAHVKKLKILVPSNKLLKEYYSIIKPIRQKIEVLQQQNQNLKETRDLLLPRLISGKLKVSER